MSLLLEPIAYAETDFDTKFGVPRQSGRVPALTARIVFLPQYRNPDALRGIGGFSHLWLIWHFSEVKSEGGFRPTVRPPRLGGNRAEGVFATRSPYRPNPIGLSSVRLLGIERTEKEGDVLLVSGADLMNGTPIFDIKPYLPFTDAHADAVGGFADPLTAHALEVVCDDALLAQLPADKRAALISVLREDPRPAYQHDPMRIYGFPFAGFEVKFSVSENTLRVTDIVALQEINR